MGGRGGRGKPVGRFRYRNEVACLRKGKKTKCCCGFDWATSRSWRSDMTSGAECGTSCRTLANITVANGGRLVPAAPYVREFGKGRAEEAWRSGGSPRWLELGCDISGRRNRKVAKKRDKTFHLLNKGRLGIYSPARCCSAGG